MSDTSKLLRVGDVFEVKRGDNIEALVPKHLVYTGKQGDWSLTRATVTVDGELVYLAATYIVTRTAMSGGGTGHGPHDIYPDGHHVTAIQADNRDNSIGFYQSGCFNTLWDREPEVIGTATQEWVWEPTP